MNLTLDLELLLYFHSGLWEEAQGDSKRRSVFLQVFVVSGDGHKLVLVCGVKFIPRLRVIGLVPGDMRSFGQPDQIDRGTAHSQNDEEELGDETRVPLCMLYCRPEYHHSSLWNFINNA